MNRHYARTVVTVGSFILFAVLFVCITVLRAYGSLTQEDFIEMVRIISGLFGPIWGMLLAYNFTESKGE